MASEDSGTIIDLVAERNKRGMFQHDTYYQNLINRMNKMELLEEMVRFNDKKPSSGKMSLTMMVRGKILFHHRLPIERKAEA